MSYYCKVVRLSHSQSRVGGTQGSRFYRQLSVNHSSPLRANAINQPAPCATRQKTNVATCEQYSSDHRSQTPRWRAAGPGSNVSFNPIDLSPVEDPVETPSWKLSWRHFTRWKPSLWQDKRNPCIYLDTPWIRTLKIRARRERRLENHWPQDSTARGKHQNEVTVMASSLWFIHIFFP